MTPRRLVPHRFPGRGPLAAWFSGVLGLRRDAVDACLFFTDGRLFVLCGLCSQEGPLNPRVLGLGIKGLGFQNVAGVGFKVQGRFRVQSLELYRQGSHFVGP